MDAVGPIDLLLLGIASFIAVTVLVRLMRARRDQLTVQLREEVRREQLRRQKEQPSQQGQAEQGLERRGA